MKEDLQKQAEEFDMDEYDYLDSFEEDLEDDWDYEYEEGR
jgi:hypothetical protein